MEDYAQDDQKMFNFHAIGRALISVSDKTGLEDFVKFLLEYKIQILSTGGTAKFLKSKGIPVTDVSIHTGSPEIMDGRVKTLHPVIHGGILSLRDNKTHLMQMETNGITPIDLVVVNFYPFSQVCAVSSDEEECIENIDIGGPSMVRSAAKNHKFVTVLTSPSQYQSVMDDMKGYHGKTSYKLRRRLAYEAFVSTSTYDAMVQDWFRDSSDEMYFPDKMIVSGEKVMDLRYGENPHQKAAVYKTDLSKGGIVGARQTQGKELSYNNLRDADSAWNIVNEFDSPTAVIVKHNNPCGVACAPTVEEAWLKAIQCDPLSSFGGIVAFNTTINAATAEHLTSLFLEVVVAPEVDEDASAILKTKKNLRVILPKVSKKNLDRHNAHVYFQDLSDGFLLQTKDILSVVRDKCHVPTQRHPTEDEWLDLLFADAVAKHVKSNAIVCVRDQMIAGVGAGQMSRVDAVLIALEKAQKGIGLKDCVAASDAFFPFADGIQALIDAGVKAVIQPGGSVRDAEVIEAADKAGIAMVFTNVRHFSH